MTKSPASVLRLNNVQGLGQQVVPSGRCPEQSPEPSEWLMAGRTGDWRVLWMAAPHPLGVISFFHRLLSSVPSRKSCALELSGASLLPPRPQAPLSPATWYLVSGSRASLLAGVHLILLVPWCCQSVPFSFSSVQLGPRGNCRSSLVNGQSHILVP